MRLRLTLLCLAIALATAAPAAAQAPVCSGTGETGTVTCTDSQDPAAGGTDSVGDPTVGSDTAADLGEDEGEDAPAAEPAAGEGELHQGEQHVLGGPDGGPAVASSQPRPEAAPTTPVATHSSGNAPAAAATASPPRTLPFTGIDAWQLALAGIALLAAGFGLRSAVARPARLAA
jgi:hypothetical protein